MKRSLITCCVVLAALVLTSASVHAQPTWYYQGKISFSAADSLARPLLCATDASGTLWVISSNNIDATAHNALYKRVGNDTVFTLVDNYSYPVVDPNVNTTRGITTIGNTVFVSNNKGTTATAAVMYVYRNGDLAKREAYGSGYGHSGYGTSLFGLSSTKDSTILTGIAFGTTTRMYNYNSTVTSPSYASYLPPPSYAMEPGGSHSNGIDIIRDVAMIPNANYSDSKTVYYSSRNSSVDHPSSGGIALWIGGTQTVPANYRTKRVADVFSDLALGNPVPYGITCDAAGHLYVAGIDSTRLWVKAYTIDTTGSATLYTELPSAADQNNPNPLGAPFVGPCDIALSPDESKAYVIDEYAKCAFVFSTTPTGVAEPRSVIPTEFSVHQNYPNPFNPSTTIRFDLPLAAQVSLKVYDMLGRLVATLMEENRVAGVHYVPFDAGAYGLTSGIYFYRLDAGSASVTRSMILAK